MYIENKIKLGIKQYNPLKVERLIIFLSSFISMGYEFDNYTFVTMPKSRRITFSSLNELREILQKETIIKFFNISMEKDTCKIILSNCTMLSYSWEIEYSADNYENTDALRLLIDEKSPLLMTKKGVSYYISYYSLIGTFISLSIFVLYLLNILTFRPIFGGILFSLMTILGVVMWYNIFSEPYKNKPQTKNIIFDIMKFTILTIIAAIIGGIISHYFF